MNHSCIDYSTPLKFFNFIFNNATFYLAKFVSKSCVPIVLGQFHGPMVHRVHKINVSLESLLSVVCYAKRIT